MCQGSHKQAVLGAAPQAALLQEMRQPGHRERLQWAHRGAGRHVGTGGPRAPAPSCPCPDRSPFLRICKTGWNPSRASLNKQSTEQSELLSTSHINIDCHVDARWSVACPPPVAPPRSPGQAWERFRGQGHNTWAMPTRPPEPPSLPQPLPQASASLLGMGTPGLATPLGKRSSFHGTLYFSWGLYPTTPPALSPMKVLLPHWEHSDLVGMIPGSPVTGIEAERTVLGR